jgi:tRNA threonylcarbamoyladenosine biosynthesis protein TsaE
MIKEVKTENEMKIFGAQIGALLKGGEVIELVGDVGAGKTTLTKGIAVGLDINEDVQSPSFTISRVYSARDNLILAHYDFYRLQSAGIMADELSEAVHDSSTIIIIEWGGVVEGVLPTDRLTIQIEPPTEFDRRLTVTSNGPRSSAIEGKL